MMASFDPNEHPHRRYNPLKDEWVLVSPHRTKRPWKGQVEKLSEEEVPAFDPTNPLCPGGQRPNGVVNPKYTETFVFQNDFAALLEDTPKESASETGVESGSLLKCEPVSGTCQVLCFHPRSDLSLALMSHDDIRLVIDKWGEMSQKLGEKYTWVQIFENKGAIMGCSNPHPHGQVWACSYLPNEPKIKDRMQQKYFEDNGRVLLMDYIKIEIQKQVRVVVEGAHWVCLVPYWAVWPYETMLIPKRHVLRLEDLEEEERKDLAVVMKKLLIKYDNLFQVSFPYSMGWHGAPSGEFRGKDCSHWQLHALYYPPLLRSATVKKFMVGFEMLSESQRDLTAEQAASTLRGLSDVHYKEKSLQQS